MDGNGEPLVIEAGINVIGNKVGEGILIPLRLRLTTVTQKIHKSRADDIRTDLQLGQISTLTRSDSLACLQNFQKCQRAGEAAEVVRQGLAGADVFTPGRIGQIREATEGVDGRGKGNEVALRSVLSGSGHA